MKVIKGSDSMQIIDGRNFIEKIPFGGGFSITIEGKVMIFFKKRDELVRLSKLLQEFLKLQK